MTNVDSIEGITTNVVSIERMAMHFNVDSIEWLVGSFVLRYINSFWVI